MNFEYFVLGCYYDSIESMKDVVTKTMVISSVGLCQEICFQENGYSFAVKVDTLQNVTNFSFQVKRKSICWPKKKIFNRMFYYIDENVFVHQKWHRRSPLLSPFTS